MKKGCLFIACFISLLIAHGQSLKKMPVSNSGCSVYGFCNFDFQKQYSEDSSIVYTAECGNDSLYYGVICIKFKVATGDLADAESIMVSYLDYLKTAFKITKSTGYGKGHQLANNAQTSGILDYWEDGDKNNWKVKAWTNGKYMAVLYGYSARVMNETKLNVFLDGIRFPGM